jgi:hypothetical protein
MGRNVQVPRFPTKRSVWGMIYIVHSSDNGVQVNGTPRQFMVNHWWGTRWRGKQWRRWGEQAQKRGRGDWWLSCDGTGGKEMIAIDVSATETNGRCWVWDPGLFFFTVGKFVWLYDFVLGWSKGRDIIFQAPFLKGMLVVNCRLRQGIVLLYVAWSPWNERIIQK